MFARQSIRVAANAAKAQPVARRSASSIASTISCISEKSVYYGKVAAELSKTVYVKEGLAPPTVAEVTKVYESIVKQATAASKDPKAFVDIIAKNAQGFSKDQILRYICYFIQVLGFFSLGEIIGRRNVVGYAEH